MHKICILFQLARLTIVLLKCDGVVRVVARLVHNQLAGVEADEKAYKADDQAKANSRKFKCPGQGQNCRAHHRLPHTKYDYQ